MSPFESRFASLTKGAPPVATESGSDSTGSGVSCHAASGRIGRRVLHDRHPRRVADGDRAGGAVVGGRTTGDQEEQQCVAGGSEHRGPPGVRCLPIVARRTDARHHHPSTLRPPSFRPPSLLPPSGNPPPYTLRRSLG